MFRYSATLAKFSINMSQLFILLASVPLHETHVLHVVADQLHACSIALCSVNHLDLSFYEVHNRLCTIAHRDWTAAWHTGT